MKNKYFLTLFLFVLLLQIQAQSNREKANELKNQAIELMENGKVEESLKLFHQAHELDPDFIDVSYDLALAYQKAKDYDKCISIAKPLIKHPDVFDKVYQLIGNTYDLKGESKKAIQYYNKGLKKFPNSGRLFFEKGIVNLNLGNLDEALNSWEKGIDVDPDYSSNYFYTSQILSQTEEKIWAIYYGEIFLNLEPGTERSQIISSLLYDNYKSCLPIKDNKWGLDFSQKAKNIVIVRNSKDFKLSFETVHNLAMEQACKNIETNFTIENIILIRKQFLTIWNEKYSKTYPNLIFQYHDLLINNNLFSEYVYWLLKDGSKQEFELWEKENNSSFENLIEWINKNPMNITNDNKTNRFCYE